MVILGCTNIDLLQENYAKVNANLNNYFGKNYTLYNSANHSATLIEHIFIKWQKKLIQNKFSSGNLITDLTNHLPNFTFFDLQLQTSMVRTFTKLLTHSKIEKFHECFASGSQLINSNELTDSN